jgi:hypothetical protein
VEPKTGAITLPLSEFTVSSSDAAALVSDLAELRAALGTTRLRVETMEEDKVNKQYVERVCGEMLAEQHRRDARADYRAMIENADRSIRDLAQELVYLKRKQEQTALAIREELNRALDNTVQSALNTVTDSLRETTVSTKALCLGCGRSSLVKTEPPRPTTPPSFFPHLSSQSIPGPDVLRGGFKMPVRSNSPTNTTSLVLGNTEKDIPLLMRHKVVHEFGSGRSASNQSELRNELGPVVSPIGPSMADTDYDGDDTGMSSTNMNDRIIASAGSDSTLSWQVPLADILVGWFVDHRRPTTTTGDLSSRVDKHFTYSQSSISQDGLRPIFRKGFPARKNMRAEVKCINTYFCCSV